MLDAWVITDGAAGNERQALALAQALDARARVLRLRLRPPWTWLAPHRLPGGRLALSARDRAQFVPPWPALAIGCGRHAALLTRLLRDLSRGGTFSVQVLDPRVHTRHWDVVIAPRHDGLRGDNVIETLGSLNPIDDSWLAQGRQAFPHFALLPQPRIALLIGGTRRGVVFDEAYARALAEGVAARAQHGSVMASLSRRTPPAFAQIMREQLARLPGLFWAGEHDGANPYPGLLGWADAIVVTPDSVNMLSEAAAVGVPVHTLVAAPLPGKLARFHQVLRERGWLHDLDAPVVQATAPLRETAQVAARIRERIASRTVQGGS